MELIPYDQPRGAVHDLARLAALSSDRCYILCISERSLYVLHNLATLDLAFASRYAVELGETGYYPVLADSAEYELFESVVNNFRLEVLDMNCDIGAGLEAIADALSNLSINVSCGGGGGVGSGGGSALPCIYDETNESLLGPGDSLQGDPEIDDPPEGFATWEEYFDYKCKAAEFIWMLERKHMVALRNFDLLTLTAAIVGPVIAGLVGVLPAAMTPPGFVVFVASVVAIGVVSAASWFYMDQMIDQWDADHDDIVCSLYNSGTSPEAVSALSNALEDAIQAIVAWGALEPVADTIAELLSTAFAQLAGNGIVEPLFKTVVAVTQIEADCSDCLDGADYYVTDYVSIEFTEDVIIHVTNESSLEGAPNNAGANFDYEYVANNGYSNTHLVVDFGELIETGPDGYFNVRVKAPHNRDHNIFRDYIHGVSQQIELSVDGESWNVYPATIWNTTDLPTYTWDEDVALPNRTFRYLKLRFLPAWFAEPISQDGSIDAIRVFTG